MLFSDGYSKEVYVPGTLKVTNLLTLGVDSGRLAGWTSADNSTRGQVQLSDEALFEWKRGTIADLNVIIDSGATMKVSGDSDHTMRGTVLHVEGTLEWYPSDITVLASLPHPNQPASQINIVGGGKFLIAGYRTPPATFPAVRTWGSDGVAFKVINHNSITVEMDNSTDFAAIKGDFATTGTTLLKNGTFKVSGLAEQTGANSQIVLSKSTSVTTATPPVFALQNYPLGIRDGKITGHGTVAGSLVMGNDPNSAGYNAQADAANRPIIAPTLAGTFGQIHVTGEFTVFKGELQVGIRSATESDRIWADTVNLKGATVGTVAANVAIPVGSKMMFLKYAHRAGDFNSVTVDPAAGWGSGLGQCQG